MDKKDFKKLIRSLTEDNIEFDEPHISLRCRENSFSKEKIIKILLYENDKLTNIIEDRPKVYKLYFKLSKRRQLKLIVDILEHNKPMIRTIKILDRKLYKKIKTIKRRR